MPTVKINGIEVEVPQGTNMIEAARMVGVEIPHYCYHPHLSIAGNCRMCLVDIEAGGRGPDIACNMQARDGLAIRTDTPAVIQMRKSVMEFLLVNHPLDCPICDQSGECRLQDYYMDYGKYESRSSDGKVNKHKRQDIGTHLMLDAERCVSCSRCVRFGDEVTETGELRLFQRTNHTEIGVFPGEQVEHAYQGVLADICPVGALTNKDFRFKKRVWYLRETPSVCTACGTGCNIQVCHENDEIFRYIPRRNDAVNKSWICDPGRETSAEVQGMKRVLRARLDGASVDLDAAVSALASRLRDTAREHGAASVGVVLGTKATNEANFALLEVVRTNLAGARHYLVEGNDPGSFDYADELLVSADKNPNTTGARALATWREGVEGGAALAAALGDGSLKLLLVLEDDVLGRLGVGAGEVAIAYVGAFSHSTAEAARILLPASHATEGDGSYTNVNGRVQRVRRAVQAAGDSEAGWALMERLGRALGTAPGASMGAVAFKRMASAVPAFAGMTYQILGDSGLDLTLPKPAPAPTDNSGKEAAVSA